MALPAYKTTFLESCLSANVLTFGTFTLKSGRRIPLACATLLELNRIDPATWGSVSYSYNRKEAKDHGEGGNIVGAALKGKTVLVIDDVITAGTAMRETLNLVAKEGGKVVGFTVALDRLEKMPGPKDENGVEDDKPRMSAMGQIRKEYGVPTTSIVTLDDLIKLMQEKGNEADMKRLEEYRAKYQASD
ncbi:orotate phosphoribosyltransferase [Aspergillus luchuensis]|uniref:orotate phosphoribosyltransferase n=1 Tax=Aspergillus kawachii TaxID=1069201 RepID=A0A146FL29_ASPKA|nr:orotate phosphoribosyltransferase [Aspergillus luchuensis]